MIQSRVESWDQIAKAAEKWYDPPAPELIRASELCPLYRRAAPHDFFRVTDAPLIAYPSAFPLRSVEDVNPQDLSALFFSPLVMRLNTIAQLSTTYMRANIDAKHCRLSHSLGTLSVLSTFMEICVTRIRADSRVPGFCIPTKEEIVGAFTYAAIHDAFQGPFGHSLDALREELVGGLHGDRRLDKTLLVFMLSLAIDHREGRVPNPPAAVRSLSNTLALTVAEPFQLDLLRLLKWLHHAGLNSELALDETVAARRREITWLYELLEGPLDADRWDYLWRDTLHLGFVDDHEALRDLLREFWADVKVAWDGKRSHLAVSASMSEGLGAVFFPLRKSLYRDVYENPEKRLIDGMLVRCIYLILLQQASVTDWNRQTREYFEFLSNLAHVTDSDLLSALEREAEHNRLANCIVLRLLRGLSTYPAIRMVWKETLSDESCRTVVTAARERLDHFTYRGTKPPEWAGKTSKDARPLHLAGVLEQTREYLSRRSQGDIKDDLLGPGVASFILHCTIMPTRPARVLQFERIVWKLVRSRGIMRSVVDKIAASLYDNLMPFGGRERRPSSDEIELTVASCPPIFVSFPWISALSEAAMREMTRDSAASAIYVDRTDEELATQSPAGLMSRASSGEAYVGAAGYPLFAVERLKPIELKFFELTAQWAVRRLLALGCCLAVPRDLLGEEHDQEIVDFILAEEPVPDER